MPDWFWESLGANGQQVNVLATRIIQGVYDADPRLLTAFNKPAFTFEVLWKAGLNLNDLKKKDKTCAGVYILFYSGFTISRDGSIYIGRSGDIRRRFADHANALREGGQLNHYYTMRRQAQNQRPRVVAILPDVKDQLTLESTLILLLQSQRGPLLVPTSDLRTFLGDTGEEAPTTTTPQEARAAAAATLKHVAIHLKTAADIAAAKSGWPGACHRPVTIRRNGVDTNSFWCRHRFN